MRAGRWAYGRLSGTASVLHGGPGEGARPEIFLTGALRSRRRAYESTR